MKISFQSFLHFLVLVEIIRGSVAHLITYRRSGFGIYCYILLGLFQSGLPIDPEGRGWPCVHVFSLVSNL